MPRTKWPKVEQFYKKPGIISRVIHGSEKAHAIARKNAISKYKEAIVPMVHDQIKREEAKKQVRSEVKARLKAGQPIKGLKPVEDKQKTQEKHVGAYQRAIKAMRASVKGSLTVVRNKGKETPTDRREYYGSLATHHADKAGIEPNLKVPPKKHKPKTHGLPPPPAIAEEEKMDNKLIKAATKAIKEQNSGLKPFRYSLAEGGPTRKHFKATAETVKAIENEDERAKHAKLHAARYARENPRFNKAKFMQACGVEKDDIKEDQSETCGEWGTDKSTTIASNKTPGQKNLEIAKNIIREMSSGASNDAQKKIEAAKSTAADIKAKSIVDKAKQQAQSKP